MHVRRFFLSFALVIKSAVFQPGNVLDLPRLPKYKQMLVHYQVELIALGLPPPSLGKFTVVLDLDNVLFQDKADL